MSRLIVDQDWESTDSPFTLSGVAMARSATNAIDSTDMRGGNGGTNSGQAVYTLAAADKPKSGSARGLRIQGYFKFKRQSGPTGGTVPIISLAGAASIALNIVDASSLLTLNGSPAGTAVLSAATAYRIDFDYEEERNVGYRMRVWVDGVLDIDSSSASGALQRLDNVSFGTSSTKTTWEFIWGRMKIWLARDPS